MGHQTAFKNVIISLIVTLLAAVLILPTIASAAVVTSGSLLLSDPRPSTSGVTYTFSASGFTTGTNIGCAELVFNTAANGSGSVPAGMTTSASTYTGSTLVGGGWTVANPGNGTIRITNGTPAAPNTSGNIVWGNITNASSEGPYYALFTTYTTSGCSVAVDSTVVAFVIVNGEPVQLTIDPSLTFSVNGVGSGLSVNGVNTTVDSSGGSVNFGNAVTASTNGISAHELAVGTNAPNGYTVYIRHSGDLTNGALDTITNWTGTNAAPTAISGFGTELWGYTTADNDLSGPGSIDRFTNGGPFWAGFTTSNAPVMDNPSAPASTETVRVGHQVGVASTTEAGTYQTVIIYTAASVY
jgi:hypothetical protein